APERIGRGHACDKGTDLGADERAAPAGRPERLVQCSRKRRRCHRKTVSELTNLHPVQTLASQTHRRRSDRCSLGRVTVLLNTASWWQRARRAGGGRRRGTARVGASEGGGESSS